MTHLQQHLSSVRVARFKNFKRTVKPSEDTTHGADSKNKPANPFSLDGISDALSDILTLSASGICRMINTKNRWPKLNTVVAVADFLEICPDMIFELARKDMRAEMQQGAIK